MRSVDIMFSILLPVLTSLLLINGQEFDISKNKFPENFLFGAATASYQIEGGWDEDGKTENIWDHSLHLQPDLIVNNDNGDIAADSYHKYKEDVQNLVYLGAKVYRFSISWNRILPDLTQKVNPKGIDYYDNLINALVAHGIQPLITIYHWDLPQYLQDIGGWLNEDIVFYYKNYADVLFQNFGDRVQYWLTFNEPVVVCHQGYGVATKAPFIKSGGIGEYICGHNLIKSHAAAWHLYNQTYKSQFNGSVGITTNIDFYEPRDPSKSLDLVAQDRMMQFELGWFAHPIFSPEGDYPKVFKDRILQRSSLEGFPKSRLPEFTEHEIKDIQGTYDFWGINHYSTHLVEFAEEAELGEPSFEIDQGITEMNDPSWEQTIWVPIVPFGLLHLMQWVHDNYPDDIKIFITENGVGTDHTVVLEDDIRVHFYKEYLSNLLEAIKTYNVNVIGYTAWSLMDDFEWEGGYSGSLGLFAVNFTDPNRPRTAKRSAAYFKKVIETRCLLEEGEGECQEEN